jgi:hypothetical protein
VIGVVGVTALSISMLRFVVSIVAIWSFSPAIILAISESELNQPTHTFCCLLP